MIKLDRKPSSGNKHFFTELCHRQTYQTYEQPPQACQNSYFQNLFTMLKWVKSFQKKISVKNIRLGDKLLSKYVFENFDFQDNLFPQIVLNFFLLCS